MMRRLVALALSVAFATSAQAATITILPGVGFTDGTARTPVGGNTATTLGQARLQVFQRAAALWGAKLSSSQVIYVNASFSVLSCSSSSGLLGWANPNAFFKNFNNTPKRDVYYPAALANALAGKRVDGSNPLAAPSSADIQAQFNSAVDGNSGCLRGVGFYYGLDNNPGNKMDLLDIVMHEMGHGLGFVSFVDDGTGQGSDSSAPNQLGIYDQFLYDETQGKYWTQLSSAQRLSSATDEGHLVWNGGNVNGGLSGMTAGVTAARHLRLYAPSPVESGSSVSHWDDGVAPNLLMQPFASASIKASLGVDLSTCAMADMGWPIAAGVTCPDNNINGTAPVAYAQNVQTTKNTRLPITLSSSNPHGLPLLFAVLVPPQHGSLSGTAPSLIYMPDANYTGSDSFLFISSDGLLNSLSALVGITVNPSAATASGSGAGTSSSSSSDSGGGAMPNLCCLLMLAGLRQLRRIRASVH